MNDNHRKALLPDSFVDSIQKILPKEEWAPFFDSYEKPAVQGLRVNPLKGERVPFADLQQVPWCETGYYYDSTLRPGKHYLHDAGAYYIQEPSAMITAELAEVIPGEYVLDLCAAPGGKSTQLAGKLKGRGLLVSNEIHPARAAILSQNIERMGVRNGAVTNHAPEELVDHFPNFFHKIIVDAPCSGEGMFRKNPEAIEEWSVEHVKMCAKRQLSILEQAVKMLRPGGRIVYSTCTFAVEEDEEVAAAFCKAHPEFTLLHERRIWPHRERGEGHYAAVFLHHGDGDVCSEISDGGKKTKKGKGKKKENLTKQQKEKYIEFASQLLTDPMWTTEGVLSHLLLFGEQLYLLPEGMVDLKGLRVLRPGLHIATYKKDRFQPAHGLAMACRPQDVKTSLYLEQETEALAYQAGQTLPCKEKGWVLVCANDYSLGWGKASNGICKNHYPKGLRRL
jgi:16S rRNA C967 or C1407 C5-methylase (RsmB/RsmF family)/NOL1/NOP2/fmu family ribosome biogenesis protein